MYRDNSWPTEQDYSLVTAFRGFDVVGIGGPVCVEGGGEVIHEEYAEWQITGVVHHSLLNG